MYRFFGDTAAYGLFNTIGYYVLLVSSLFFFKQKRNAMGGISKIAISFFNRLHQNLGKIAGFLLASIEAIIIARMINYSTYLNMAFGSLVGTGGNYFATIILAPILIFVISLIIFANPIKQIDIYTLLLPIYLIPVKLACFFNGCCWGIPWEHGMYNYHYDHPGKQVPVQLIEAIFALVIFIFLFFYRKKAKPGTVFPMYMILYGGTRFFSEFLTAAYPDIVGPFNMYQILCTISVVVGLVLFFVMKKYGERISDFFEKPQKKFERAIGEAKQNKALKLAEEKAKEEAEMLERLEKAKEARAKASVKYKKK